MRSSWRMPHLGTVGRMTKETWRRRRATLLESLRLQGPFKGQTKAPIPPQRPTSTTSTFLVGRTSIVDTSMMRPLFSESTPHNSQRITTIYFGCNSNTSPKGTHSHPHTHTHTHTSLVYLTQHSLKEHLLYMMCTNGGTADPAPNSNKTHQHFLLYVVEWCFVRFVVDLNKLYLLAHRHENHVRTFSFSLSLSPRAM